MPDRDSLVDAAQHAILVDRFEVDTIAGVDMLQPGSRRVIVLRFSGRVNGRDDHLVATAALTPEGAANLVRTIVESYSATVPTDAFGNPT